jgi:prepilin-type N-terminal cleavage/methylation domain-containing protein
MDTKSSRHHAGFTLVELLIVVIIVGILASVAIPLYRGATERAYLTEADTALGVIQRSMRTVLISQSGGSGSWSFLTAKYTPDASLKISDVIELRIDETDLDGRFFDNGSYRLQSLTATTYAIYAYGDSSSTPNKNSVAGMIRSINQR